MRIISGEFRNRILVAPEGQNTRPTAERAREAVFSILQNRLYGSVVLDLFAGSGAMGLEALSRGSARAVLVESDRAALRAIRENVRKLRVEARAEILGLDFTAALGRARGPFDLVFLDPPYGKGLIPQALKLLREQRLLASDALLVAEHEEDLPRIPGYEVVKNRRYGRAHFTFYQPEEETKE